MAKKLPVIHGSDHLPGHADPTFRTYPIRYDVDNTGAWLDVTTTGADGSGYAMHFVADDEVFFDLDESTASSLFQVDAFHVTANALGTTAQLILQSEYDAHITADRNLALVGGTDNVAGAGISAVAPHGDINITSNIGAIGLEGTSGITLLSPSGAISFSSPLVGITFNSPTQQTTPVTLADVIAVLNSYGLTV